MTAFAPAVTAATFLDPLALGIVVGGTLATAVLRTPLVDLRRGLAALTALPPRRRFDGDAAVAQIAAFRRIAQRHGLAALERNIVADRDVAAGVAAVAAGCPADEVTALLDHLRTARSERHCAAAELWAGAAEAAPAMGMVGTLVGLVAMFTQMTDPTAIGRAMAVALLATLYGALLANLVLMPVAARLRRLAQAEASARARIVAPLSRLADIDRARVRAAQAA